ncbi:hypothetical protein OsI_33100 [Oryza sativa Indica Group]|uniref:Uncharacterized protein n=1 Tax=Oryza sativa subsp. indica TaxID=39946 RepID=B8BG91_ORYSI|nr:hypothetical protein OsI_33100 [Oryza sativa Indica Group]
MSKLFTGSGLCELGPWTMEDVEFGFYCGLLHATVSIFFFRTEFGFASPTASSTSARLRYRHRLSFDFIIPPRASSALSPVQAPGYNDFYNRSSSSTRLRHQALGCRYVALSGCSVAAYGPPLLVVGMLRGALLSVASPPVEFSLLHRHRVAPVLPLRVTALPLSSSSPFAHRQPRHLHWSSSAAQSLLRLLRASPLHLQAAIVATLVRWSSYLYMATDVAVQAIGPATSPSTSSSMTHRQRRRIFLDYTSLFSNNRVLLRQFSLYAVLAPRSSWRPSLLVSSDIGI